MGGGIILFVVFVLVIFSILVLSLNSVIQEYFGFAIRYSLWNRNETYLALGTLFTVGAI